VQKIVTDAGISAIVDFEFIPFGNSYSVTPGCGGEGNYNVDARHCFFKKCGKDSNHPDDCFTGALVCQHGDAECQGNRYMACAKKVDSQVGKYMSFVHCLEAGFESLSEQMAAGCADTAGIDKAALSDCFNGDSGQAALIEEAKKTPDHEGVPWILVNGQSIDPPEGLVGAVCNAYTGPKPPGCSSLIEFPVKHRGDRPMAGSTQLRHRSSSGAGRFGSHSITRAAVCRD